MPTEGEVVTLHAHFDRRMDDLWNRIDDRLEDVDQRFDAAEKATKAALVASEKAVEKAETLAHERNIKQNEWRATVTDIMAGMVPRGEYDASYKSVNSRISDLTESFMVHEGGQKGMQSVIPWVIAAAGAVVAFTSLVFTFTH